MRSVPATASAQRPPGTGAFCIHPQPDDTGAARPTSSGVASVRALCRAGNPAALLLPGRRSVEMGRLSLAKKAQDMLKQAHAGRRPILLPPSTAAPHAGGSSSSSSVGSSARLQSCHLMKFLCAGQIRCPELCGCRSAFWISRCGTREKWRVGVLLRRVGGSRPAIPHAALSSHRPAGRLRNTCWPVFCALL